MQSPEGEIRSQAKNRLTALLKAAVSGVVVATASLATPPAAATVAPAKPQATLEQRIQDVRDLTVNPADGFCAEEHHGHHWGNHWDKWHNWNNWHNWHNW